MAVWRRLGNCFTLPFVGLVCPQASSDLHPQKSFQKEDIQEVDADDDDDDRHIVIFVQIAMTMMTPSVLLVPASPVQANSGTFTEIRTQTREDKLTFTTEFCPLTWVYGYGMIVIFSLTIAILKCRQQFDCL